MGYLPPFRSLYRLMMTQIPTVKYVFKFAESCWNIYSASTSIHDAAKASAGSVTVIGSVVWPAAGLAILGQSNE